jgi:hypothetical protein
MKISVAIFLFFALFSCQTTKLESSWKNIKVFKTTRDEVEKLLGKPVDRDGKISYETADALIYIYYSGAPCGNSDIYGQGYNIPKDTVFSYRVILRKEVKVSELEWDENSYQQEQDEQHLPEYAYYYNAKAGIYITTVKTDLQDNTYQIVKSIEFGRTKEQDIEYKCR